MNKIETTVRDLTTAYINALATRDGTRTTYLRTLVEETQRELGAQPRTNNATKRSRLSDDDRARQLAALAAVHARFYVIILAVVEDSLKDVASKDRAREKNRRANFARTALYAARLYVRAGKDITALAPAKLSKSTLAVAAPTPVRTPRRLKNRVERASKAFVKSILELGEADKQAAVSELDTLIGIMANQLAALGVPMARDAKQAAAEHRPYRQGSTLFVPSETMVIRQTARPS